MNCPGCLLTARELQIQLVSITLKAKQFAIDSNKTVVIYRMDEGEYGYMEAEAARRAGITPVQFVSAYQPVTDGKIY